MEDKPNESAINRVIDFFASVKLSIVLLLTLAGTSVVGTLIAQDKPDAWLVRQYGEFLYRLFTGLGLFDLYHSWWFQLLMLLLALNLIVCSAKRLPTTWKVTFPKSRKPNPGQFNQAAKKNSHQMATKASTQKTTETIAAFLSRRLRHVETKPDGKAFLVAGEKGRWTRLGAYVIHLGFILILIGGLMGSLYGFNASVNITEGDAADRVMGKNRQEMYQLPFTVRCDDFFVEFYKDGAPKEFRSTLTVIEDGKEVFTKDIRVNHPLRYRGINLFQSSYGEAPPSSVDLKHVDLLFTEEESGMATPISARPGEHMNLPGGKGEFEVLGFQPDFAFRGHSIGPSVIVQLYTAGHEENGRPIALPVEFPTFDKMRQGVFTITVEDYTIKPYDKVWYTGLMVTRDPGVPVVYAGFLLLILGCIVTFFLGHQRVLVKVEPRSGKTRVTLAGTATRNRHGFELRLERMSKELEKALEA